MLTVYCRDVLCERFLQGTEERKCSMTIGKTTMIALSLYFNFIGPYLLLPILSSNIGICFQFR